MRHPFPASPPQKKSIHLTIAFFLPDTRLQKAFIDAAVRGVDVRIVLHTVKIRYSSILNGTPALCCLNLV